MMGDVPPQPLVLAIQPSTNRFHLTFTFDPVSNATWYAVIVRTNGIEAFRRWSMTNFVTVSNLSPSLDQYSFTAVATNALGISDESVPAPKKLVILQDGTNVLNIQPTNTQQLFTNLHTLSIRQWNAQQNLKKD